MPNGIELVCLISGLVDWLERLPFGAIDCKRFIKQFSMAFSTFPRVFHHHHHHVQPTNGTCNHLISAGTSTTL